MWLELDDRDAALLASAVRSRVSQLTQELAHTEQHDLRHDLAMLLAQLELVSARLDAARLRPSLEPDGASAR